MDFWWSKVILASNWRVLVTRLFKQGSHSVMVVCPVVVYAAIVVVHEDMSSQSEV